MEPSQERELLARCRGGDREAFSRLVEVYEVGDGHLADDLAQQAFLNAYQALPRFRGESRFSTWIYRITVNVCGMHLRRRKEISWGDDWDPQIVDADLGPAESANQAILRERLERALPRLPWAQRRAISLFYLEGVSYSEIAEILEAPVGTVKAWMSRGLVRLRQGLREERFL